MSGLSDHGREHAPDAHPHDRSQAGGSTPESWRHRLAFWWGSLLFKHGARIYGLPGTRHARLGLRMMVTGAALMKAARP